MRSANYSINDKRINLAGENQEGGQPDSPAAQESIKLTVDFNF
jgi:hypothetical protein